jgi:hypothetical protein
MYAIEFETFIEDNLVKLPMTDTKPLAGKVKVIVLQEESVKETATLIDELLAHPLDLPNFVPFSREEIYAAR